MRIKYQSIVSVLGILLAVAPAGCGGKLAKTGSAAITGVSRNGEIRMNYECGKTKWKRIDCGNIREGIRTAEENRFKPARYVETKSGSTLTFPGGKTITYQDLH